MSTLALISKVHVNGERNFSAIRQSEHATLHEFMNEQMAVRSEIRRCQI